jgi:tripeptide aminopeptidase
VARPSSSRIAKGLFVSSQVDSPAVLINRGRLLDRFLEYVQIGSSADANANRYPSSDGQLKLGKLLTEQLKKMGIEDAHQDSNGLVWATIPSTIDEPCATVLLNSHLDTSPEAPGDNVRPAVIESYAGGDIPLADGKSVIRVEQCPALSDLVGTTLITTDGRTLLGSDDKSGVAVIMELAEVLMERRDLPHGPVRILFTCDEEIGRGTKHVELRKAAATVGYTLDGGGAGQIDQETFSADMAIVRFVGHNIHPSIAKGRMVNAVRAAGLFLAELPMDRLSPESTDDRDGFVHPYDIAGGVGEVKLQFILRDFETARLVDQANLLRTIANKVESQVPGIRIEVNTQRQYRNMADGLKKLPMAVELAERAFHVLGVPCERSIVRGGTDGSLLTEMGLPTPNLSCGQHNIHSVFEFACLDQMQSALAHLIVLLDLWQQTSRA